MKVRESSGAEIHWISQNENSEKWFECKLNLIDFSIEKTTDEERAGFIQSLIRAAAQLNSDFLSQWKKYRVVTQLEFDSEWGWGSSSTLTTNLARWAELSPFELYFETQKGSGYDVAAAMASGPILYQKSEEELSFEGFDMNPDLLDHMYVFYQGKKSDSAKSVRSWKSVKKWTSGDVALVSEMSEKIAGGCGVSEAIDIFKEHERLLSGLLDLPLVQDQYSGFEGGVIKSLGAWGGDFALALHPDQNYSENYFKSHSIDTWFRLADIVLQD